MPTWKRTQKKKSKPRKLTTRQVEKLLRRAAKQLQTPKFCWQKIEKRLAAEQSLKESTK